VVGFIFHKTFKKNNPSHAESLQAMKFAEKMEQNWE